MVYTSPAQPKSPLSLQWVLYLEQRRHIKKNFSTNKTKVVWTYSFFFALLCKRIEKCIQLFFESHWFSCSQSLSTRQVSRQIELITAQLNEYETAPDFLQLSQNMTSDCLFTFVFSPVFTWIYLFCALNCSEHQNKTIFSAKQENSGRIREKHKSKHTICCHVLA